MAKFYEIYKLKRAQLIIWGFCETLTYWFLQNFPYLKFRRIMAIIREFVLFNKTVNRVQSGTILYHSLINSLPVAINNRSALDDSNNNNNMLKAKRAFDSLHIKFNLLFFL